MKEKIDFKRNKETFIIVDFEATCCNRNSFPRNEMEIIEIGSVAIDQDALKPLSEFQSFIRPIRHPQLTAFCKELTSIKQHNVNDAPEFTSALSEFNNWINQFENPVFCSWGYYDKKQLIQDCKFHHLAYPFTDKHINIKELFALNMGLRKGVGLGKALKLVNLKFQGTAHRGIDDARNMSRIAKFIFSQSPGAENGS